MRFHLTMFFVTIAVSMGMHAMASAAPITVETGAVVCSADAAATKPGWR